jgi:hypothetical protein
MGRETLEQREFLNEPTGGDGRVARFALGRSWVQGQGDEPIDAEAGFGTGHGFMAS